jgi:hypothetical protein
MEQRILIQTKAHRGQHGKGKQNISKTIYNVLISGLYYKNIMIINDASTVVSE